MGSYLKIIKLFFIIKIPLKSNISSPSSPIGLKLIYEVVLGGSVLMNIVLAGI